MESMLIPVFVRGELSIDRALINYRNAVIDWFGKMLEKICWSRCHYDGDDMGSYFGRAGL